jgi:hypothetical protein
MPATAFKYCINLVTLIPSLQRQMFIYFKFLNVPQSSGKRSMESNSKAVSGNSNVIE